jgi:uncharacterized protein
MKLSLSEEKEFYKNIDEYLASEYVQSMKQYIQHGNTTTYRHCIMVSYYSYWICLRLHLKCDMKSVAKGALLHDFYLYDWHEPDSSHRLHGFYHSGVALVNARKHFVLNPIEEDIIAKHMWPLTITKLPKYKESLVVCFVDKLCSVAEIFYLT